MEVELEPRVKPLGYKVKAMSRESPAQKAVHLLDADLRNHWSTATNIKEWILLELDEPSLLSHIRIYNKSVLEWEISVGLVYKPETFVKVRSRSDAPRRDMVYPTNYTPCRYVRISCMRGNPIAIYFIQLIGIPVVGLEPEFQPVANYIIPRIISQKQDDGDMYLQLLQDVTSRLAKFLPHLEGDLNDFQNNAEPTLKFLAMLAGPFYPILQIVNERESARLVFNVSEYEASKPNLSSTTLTVSSNFEPRRLRNTSSVLLPISTHVVFRPDAIFMLLRKALKVSNLGNLCRMASRVFLKLMEPMTMQEESAKASDVTSSVAQEATKSDLDCPVSLTDYSELFGEEFQILDDFWDPTYLNVLDIAAVEEGLMHVLYASASQPLHYNMLVENNYDICSALPLVQALLPALRPNVSSPYQIDDNFSLWKQPFVYNALSQIVATSSSSTYRPLLHACAGYLSSFSPSHVKAACVLIDMCSGVLAPWIAQVTAKVDLTMELLEDLLGVIQGTCPSLPRVRASLKYIVLALSGHMDDIMAKYKDAKHQILFLLEMLEPYLDPALSPLKGMIAFGNVPATFVENQEENCIMALNVIRTAIRKSAVLPSLEAEWRRGSVSPSVLLSVLDNQIELPSDIDNCKFSPEIAEPQPSTALPPPRDELSSSRSNDQESTDPKGDDIDTYSKLDVHEDVSLLFVPPELNRMSLTHVSASPDINSSGASHFNVGMEVNSVVRKKLSNKHHDNLADQGIGFSNLLADYSQLMNYRGCELKASEFRQLASDLNSQSEITVESQDVAIDALLLAAECYINPCFMNSFKDISPDVSKACTIRSSENHGPSDVSRTLRKKDIDLKLVSDIERKRDRVVLEILIEAAKLDRKYHKVALGDETTELYVEGVEDAISLSDEDTLSADAITLMRQNQSLLCNFLIRYLQKDSLGEQHSIHETLMWCLLFLLHSATKLFCDPETVVDIILVFAESLNMQFKALNYQLKEGNSRKQHEVERRWSLLQRLVIASSGNDERSELSISIRNGFRFSNLVPSSAWLLKVPKFMSSVYPLVRYFGWMAVARNAKQYLQERLFLVSDLSQLMNLLSIFSDDLSLVDNIIEQKDMKKSTHQDIYVEDGGKNYGYQDELQSFHALYPDISNSFPTLRKEFKGFGDTILEAVGLHLKFLSSTIVPDLICWFSDLCSSPFVQSEKAQVFHNKSNNYKGFVAKNAKAVILYILEAIVVEHMEALVPEVPRVVQVLVSLCRTSYCDVSFLDSILRLLKPIMVYSLSKVSDVEKVLVDESWNNFESLCFRELFNNIRNTDIPTEKGNPALTIFILSTIFKDLSFQRKTELLQSTILWAEFTSSQETTFFHDYLCAYQVLMESCKDLLNCTLRVWGIVPIEIPGHSDTNFCTDDDFSKSSSRFLDDICKPYPVEGPEKHQNDNDAVIDVGKKDCQLTLEEIKIFSRDLEALILILNPTIEQCWKIHHKLAEKLAITTAECFVLSKCLCLIAERVSASSGEEKLFPSGYVEEFPGFWKISLEGLANMILVLQDNHCWEVAYVFLNSILGVPRCFHLDNVISGICSALKNFSNSAPNIRWRLLTDKMISLLLARGIHEHCRVEIPLADFFSDMLGHPEPEQRYIALKHLGRLTGQDVEGRSLFLPLTNETDLTVSESHHSASELMLSALVSATWDQVALMISSDPSLLIRTHAISLLLSYIPFAERSLLQSFLAAADGILQCLTTLAQPTSYGPLTQFSLALIASVCLYSPAEDISLIPESIWRNVEVLATSKADRYCTGLEQKACEALCRVKNDGNQAKQILKEVLSSNPQKQQIADFATTRESIIQVIGNLTSARTYFDFFSKEVDQKNMELEEAEMEMELLRKEHPLSDSSIEFQDWRQIPFLSAYAKDDQRLRKIKDEVKSIEKAKLREEIAARRQKKLLVSRARQQFLEEAALREAELIQNLDRERTSEVEKELERQQLLELERAKTKELRYNLEMEKEKQAQRELQRELEQMESGLRPSRKEFGSSNHNRARDRYRERENSRESNEGNLRTNTPRIMQHDRPFQNQVPTILQSRERSEECSSNYEENFDGSKDSGDTGSVGDPDIMAALDGQSGNFARHGSRGSNKSRQIIDRRERDGRREGKWERKH